eukprot:3264733-Amphidinium_carterae.5
MENKNKLWTIVEDKMGKLDNNEDYYRRRSVMKKNDANKLRNENEKQGARSTFHSGERRAERRTCMSTGEPRAFIERKQNHQQHHHQQCQQPHRQNHQNLRDPYRYHRENRRDQRVENTMGNKKTQIKQTPSVSTLTPRLRLMKQNCANVDDKKQPDAYYEQRLLQEAIRRRYILKKKNLNQYNPTTGYRKATNEIRAFYDGFEIYNWHDQLSPATPIEDDRTRSSTMRSLLTICHYQLPLRQSVL